MSGTHHPGDITEEGASQCGGDGAPVTPICDRGFRRRSDEALNALLHSNTQHQQASSFRVLCNLYQRPFLGFLSRKGLRSSDAEAVAGDALLAVWPLRGSNIRVENSFSYVWTICHNRYVSWYRGKEGSWLRRRQSLDAIPEDSQSADSFVADAENECLKEALKEFAISHPERWRVLRMLLERSPQEIAREIGRTKAATYQYLSESRKKLRELLLERCGFSLRKVQRERKS